MRNNINSVRVSLYSLLTSHNINKIVVPIIQRDYAQGRKHERDVRQNFLRALLCYLADPDKESHDLDFIYGNKNTDNEFIPLDGQQRLTTLFLLHYYLSIHDDMYSEFERVFIYNGQSRFCYETRSSASDFCNALVTNPIPKESLGKISEVLVDEFPWFSQSWINDPTVAAMLHMLDSIHHVFSDQEGLFSRLIAEDNPAVTFRALFMQESGLNDDLYIKMNSRGLELSRFENLKARIIQKLKDNKEKTYSLRRTKQKPAENVSICDYFSFKIDINWTDLFWIYRKELKRKTDSGEEYKLCEVDTSLINFITTVALNYNAINNIEITNSQMTSYDKLGWSFYDHLPNDFYKELIDVFDVFEEGAIYDDEHEIGISNRITDKNVRFKVRDTFKNFVHKNFTDAAYSEHIQFYAYYSYLINHKDSFNQNDFNEWMRIVTNLTNNHTWQNEKDFVRSITTIKWLLTNNVCGILELLGRNKDVKDTGFNPSQFKEERMKAALQLRDDGEEWRTLIVEAEKHEYFKGQISSIINFSGIEKYYDSHNQECDWADEESLMFKASFGRYTKLMQELFTNEGLSPKYEEKQILRRAILCYGEFGKWYGGKRWSFLKNKHRDYSWKRFLLEERTRDFLKQLFDNYDNSVDFLKYLEKSIEEFESSDEYKSYDLYYWRNILIRESQVWDCFGEDNFLCFDNNENDVYVLGNKTMGGWHSEIRSLSLMLELRRHYELQLDYDWSESWEKFPSLSVTIPDALLPIIIKYRDNVWHLKVNSIDNVLVDKLETLGFVRSDDGMCRMSITDSPVDIIGKIVTNDHIHI